MPGNKSGQLTLHLASEAKDDRDTYGWQMPHNAKFTTADTVVLMTFSEHIAQT